MESRLAETQDANEITRVINDAFRKAESFLIDCDRIDLDTVLSLMQKGKFLVAEDEDHLTGCVYLEPRGERVYLGLLAIDPALQKSGLGSMLLKAAEDKCIREGFRDMDLRTVNLRTDNREFYSRRGYVETGTEPFISGLIPKVPCHFVWMSKRLV